VLRQVLERHVPAALVERPKMGFGLPIGGGFAASRAWAEDLLNERRLRDQVSWTRSRSDGRGTSPHRPTRLGLRAVDVLVLQSWLNRWMPGLG